jgi:DNA primase catalytic subunit
VFLAIFLTCSVWRAYHHAIEFERLKGQYTVLKWLESEVIIDIDADAFERFNKKNM